MRRVALEEPQRSFTRIAHLLDRIHLHPVSLDSYPFIFHVLSRHEFDECYHLGAQSFVAESFADGSIRIGARGEVWEQTIGRLQLDKRTGDEL